MNWKISVWIISLIGCFSCIQSEPLNKEADITTFALPDNIAVTDPVIGLNDISITVRKDADLTSLIPIIETSEGATLSPAPGTACDFTKPVIFTVTSENKEYQKVYTIQAITYSFYKFGFEHWEQLASAKYETPVEYNMDNEQVRNWDSSNKGIAIYQQHSEPSLFPIHRTTTRVSGEYAAEMVTGKGPGKIFNMNIPIAAGSLFTGNLNLISAMKDPLLATEFGQHCDERPVRLTGYYMYRAGTGDYIDPNGNVLPNVKDSCSVYSVFFKVDEKTQYLDGTNIFTHPNIIAMAMMPDEDRAGSKGDDFVYFDIPFEYRTNEPVDFEKNTYKLAVVFSSSFYGDRYEGVPGSRLIVDEVEVITEN